jgi:MFS family permease
LDAGRGPIQLPDPMNRALRLSQYLAFAALGVTMSLLGPLLPAIRAEIPMSYLEAGLVLSGQFLGMLLSVPPGGHLADRIGRRPFLLASAVLTVAGLTATALAPGLGTLLAAAVVTGVGSGGFEVGVNAVEVDHVGEGAGRAMNLLHFFFGVGAIAGPVLAAGTLGLGLGWRVAFLAAAALPAAVGLALLPQRLLRSGKAAVHDPAAIYRSAALWRYALVIALYVALETTAYGWAASYWERRGAAFLPAALVASLFWSMLTLGRLLCGGLADRMGLARFVRRSAAAALVACAAWMAWPTPWLTLGSMLLLGLALSGIFPTTMALVTEAFPGHAGKVVAFLAVFASLGGFAGPTVAGRLADLAGIEILPPFAAGLALAMLVAVRWARRGATPPPLQPPKG